MRPKGFPLTSRFYDAPLQLFLRPLGQRYFSLLLSTRAVVADTKRTSLPLHNHHAALDRVPESTQSMFRSTFVALVY